MMIAVAAEETVKSLLQSGKLLETSGETGDQTINFEIAKSLILDNGMKLSKRDCKKFTPFFSDEATLQIPSNYSRGIPLAIVFTICVYWFGDIPLSKVSSLLEDLDYAYGTTFTNDWRDCQCHLP